MSEDTAEWIGDCFVEFCKEQTIEFPISLFTRKLEERFRRKATVREVYRSSGSQDGDIYFTERKEASPQRYWLVTVGAENYLLPRPIRKDSFDDGNNPHGFTVPPSGNISPESLRNVWAAVVRLNGSRWELQKLGGIDQRPGHNAFPITITEQSRRDSASVKSKAALPQETSRSSRDSHSAAPISNAGPLEGGISNRIHDEINQLIERGILKGTGKAKEKGMISPARSLPPVQTRISEIRPSHTTSTQEHTETSNLHGPQDRSVKIKSQIEQQFVAFCKHARRFSKTCSLLEAFKKHLNDSGIPATVTSVTSNQKESANWGVKVEQYFYILPRLTTINSQILFTKSALFEMEGGITHDPESVTTVSIIEVKVGLGGNFDVGRCERGKICF